MTKSGAAIVAIALATASTVGAIARPARAQFFRPGDGTGGPANIEGLTVAGKGEVSARPNLLEIDLEVSAASELTADAIVKYRDARRKLQEAFEALKLANVAVEERGLLVDKKGAMNSRYSFMYEPAARTKTEVQLSRKLVVQASEIRGMEEDALLQLAAKLLDVAQDAGARLGAEVDPFSYYYYGYAPPTQGLVRFVLDDFETIQEDAYARAIADARSRAERLARLGGMTLGPVVGVREVVVPGDQAPRDEGPMRSAQDDNDDAEPRKRLVASKFQPIPIRVELLVRFEVRREPEAKAPAGD